MFNFYLSKLWKSIQFAGCYLLLTAQLFAAQSNYLRPIPGDLSYSVEDRNGSEINQDLTISNTRYIDLELSNLTAGNLVVSDNPMLYIAGRYHRWNSVVLFFIDRSFSLQEDRELAKRFFTNHDISIQIYYFVGDCFYIGNASPVLGSLLPKLNNSAIDIPTTNILGCSLVFHNNDMRFMNVTKEDLRITENDIQEGNEFINSYSKMLIVYVVKKDYSYPDVIGNLIMHFVGVDNFFSTMIVGLTKKRELLLGDSPASFQVICLHQSSESEFGLDLVQDYAFFPSNSKSSDDYFFDFLFFLIAPQTFFNKHDVINSKDVVYSMSSDYSSTDNFIKQEQYYAKSKRRGSLEKDVDLNNMEDVD